MQRITIFGEPTGTEVEVARELDALEEEERAWEEEHQLRLLFEATSVDIGAKAKRKTKGPSLV